MDKNDTRALARSRHGQALLPMVELIEQSQLALDELIDVLPRASVCCSFLPRASPVRRMRGKKAER